MATGTVKWFNDKNGYGFIEEDGVLDVFLHHIRINMSGFKTLKEAKRVSFEIQQGQKRGWWQET
jgi:CspA family cold shock protein